jgi:hypothetical protein
VGTYEAGAGDVEWPAVRDEAIAVLGDALAWCIPAARWDQVRGAIEDMASAAAPASADELWQAAGSLELLSPARVATRLGDTSFIPAPEAVRERIVELIDALAPASEPVPESESESEADGYGSGHADPGWWKRQDAS